MAIISSVIMSRATGSIGNVTLSTQKGRVIAKQKASIVSNPNTEAQRVQRGRISKAVLAWQFLGNYIKSGITALVSYGSEYNTFTSKNMPLYEDNSFENNEVKGVDLVDSFATIGKLGTLSVSSIQIENTTADVSIETEHFKSIAKIGDTLKILVVDMAQQKIAFGSVKVEDTTFSRIGSGLSINVDTSEFGSRKAYALWLETSDGKNSTTSKFVQSS